MIGRDALSGALKEKDEDLMTHMDSTSESQPQATAPTVSPYSAEKPGRDCPRKGHATMAVQIAHDTRWMADGTCSYCGSLNEDTFMRRLEVGDISLEATDKNYKVYVANAGGESMKQTYRDCYERNGNGSLGAKKQPECHSPDDCTHWVTRETSHAKFYFEHLTEDQKRRFVELVNEKRIKFDGGGFYVRPFFIGAGAKNR